MTKTTDWYSFLNILCDFNNHMHQLFFPIVQCLLKVEILQIFYKPLNMKLYITI